MKWIKSKFVQNCSNVIVITITQIFLSQKHSIKVMILLLHAKQKNKYLM